MWNQVLNKVTTGLSGCYQSTCEAYGWNSYNTRELGKRLGLIWRFLFRITLRNGCHDHEPCVLLQNFQVNIGMLPWNKSQMLPSTFLSLHHSYLTVSLGYTPSPCCTLLFLFTHFSLNTSSQFKILLNLHSLFFGLCPCSLFIFIHLSLLFLKKI